MDTTQFKKVARLLKEAYSQMEQEAEKNGVDFLSPEYDQLKEKVRQAVVEKSGYTMEQYLNAKALALNLTDKELTLLHRIQELEKGHKLLKEVHVPTTDEITATAHSVASQYIKPPQIINKIVKEKTIEKPQIVETVRIQRETYDPTEILNQINDLRVKVAGIPAPIEPLNIQALKDEIKQFNADDFANNLERNIDVLRMPDWRKLAMGLQGQIDAVRSASGVSSFNTRTGAVTLSSLDVTTALGYTPGTGSGTVTAVSVATANGFAGTSSGGATPALTLTTSVTGLMQGNGTAISGITDSSTTGLVLRVTGASTYAWGALDLANTNAVTGALPVANGGTGLAVGTSGGIPYFSSTTTIASSGALTASAIVLGGGAGATPTSLALGTANQVLGMTNAGTAHEYKTVSVGTTGSDFNVVLSGANAIVIHLPSAGSATLGKVSTSGQTFAGAKSFTSVITESQTLVVTSTDGFIMTEATNASAGTPVRYSPRTRYSAKVWNTNAGGSAVTQDWTEEVIPVSGNPSTSVLRFGSSSESGAYTFPFAIQNNGVWQLYTTAGTANQIAGVTNAGTGMEWKTVSISSTAVSNDCGITLSTANSIIVNIPDCSPTVRGVVTTGTQSFGGVKTFATAGTTFTTGNGGAMVILGAAGTPAGIIQASFWFDNTNNKFAYVHKGTTAEFIDGTLFTSTTTVTTASNTETSLVGTVPATNTATIPASRLQVGTTIPVKARGYFSSALAGGGQMRFKLKLGTTVILDTGAVAPAGNVTNDYWEFDGEITVRTTGAGGTVFAQGTLRHGDGASTNDYVWKMTNTATTAVDTTAAQLVDVTHQWTAPAGADSVSCSNVWCGIRN